MADKIKSKYRVCSWDVGIKNLAYCILEIDGDKFKILDWDIINLVKENKLTCCGSLKSSTICGKNAKFKTTYKKEVKGYCKTHSSQYTPILESRLKDHFTVDSKKEKHKCTYINKNDKDCPSKGFNLFDDKYLCNSHYKQINKRFSKDIGLQKKKKQSCYGEGPFSLSQKLVNCLDKIPELLDVDDVIIENQPSLKNPAMKTVASFLYSYFTIRSVVDADKNNKRRVQEIKFISPSNKLKVNEDQTMEVLNGAKADKTYKLTKQLAIKYTKILLKNDSKMLKHLETYKKKDDLCDAFLQGYHFVFFRKFKKEIKTSLFYRHIYSDNSRFNFY
jgi:hypothetical protein